VTGYSDTADSNISSSAFVTSSSGQLFDLGTLGGPLSAGRGINNTGQVVGYSFLANNSEVAFVTDNGVMKDLNTLLVSGTTDWVLTEAFGINDAGQITGSGIHNGVMRAFLMTPVPVPAAVWMMGSGLFGLLGFNSRRRANA
jgi:probable HAF family extracellular repeat protein